MDLSNLEKILETEPTFRLKQAKEALFKNFISDWSEATFFSKNLRDRLNTECPLEIKADVLVSEKPARIATQSVAGGGSSVKAKIILTDGLAIETVLMRHKDARNTVCVSSQVGCPLGCLFCATGKMGFKRNLSVYEILEQVIFFERYFRESPAFAGKAGLSRVTNVTFMGMGELFLNYENVLEAIKILNNKEYFNIGARSISVSTAGIIEGIQKFSEEDMQVNLAISLHAPNDKLRGELMPVNKKYPLAEVLKAVDNYIKKTNRKVMFEYVLIKEVNDSEECAKELAMIMNKKLYFLNLILYNATGEFQPSTTKRVEAFKSVLKNAGINFVQRYRFGEDIKAACGQFITGK